MLAGFIEPALRLRFQTALILPLGLNMGDEMKNPTGINLLLKECRRRFRIPENLNHYSDKDFREAEKKFIKLCFIGGHYQEQQDQRDPLK